MGSPTAEELNGLRETKSYDDGTVVRVFCMRTTHDSYPSGWAYNLHYGTTEPDRRERSTLGRSVATTTLTRPRKATNCISRPSPNQRASSSSASSPSGTAPAANSRNACSLP